MINPYWGTNFWEFFSVLGHRLIGWIRGDVNTLASDEVQLLVLVGVAIASASIGVFLVLRKMTMLANSLSHTILLGIVLAYLATLTAITGSPVLDLKILLIGALIAGILTTLFTQMLTHFLKVQEDASIGLVFTTFFALGIVIVTLFTRSTHIGTEAIMGNVDALHPDDLKITSFICLFNLIPIFLLFKEFKMTTFDPAFAKTIGFSPSFFSYLLMIQVAATAIGAFRAVGVLLFLALLVGPVLTARLFTHHLGRLLFLSMGIGALAALVAVALSRHLLSVYQIPLSTAGLVVTMIGIFYFLALLFKKVWKEKRKRANL